MYNVLGKRLKQLREQHKLTQKEAASIFDLTNFQMSRYEKGQSNPDPELIAKFAEHYKVTTDYLLGRSDKQNYTAEQESIDSNEDYDSIQEINRLLKEYGIDQSGFFDIELWRAMGPEEIKQLESYFKFITEEAKKKNQEDE